MGLGMHAEQPSDRAAAPSQRMSSSAWIAALSWLALAGATACEDEATGLNEAPTAEAGPDQSVAPGDSVVLDGERSRDDDGQIVEYRWLQTGGAPVELFASDTARARFDAPTEPDELSFTLVVVDDRGATGRDDVAVVVANPEGPVADAGADFEVRIDAPVELDGSDSTDPDGEIVAFSWEQTRGQIVELSDSEAVAPRFTAPSRPSLLVFRLSVEDDDGNTDEDEVAVAVRDNLSPTADAGPDVIGEPSQRLEVDGTNSADPDGEVVSHAWVQVDGPSAQLDGADRAVATVVVPGEPGVVELELTVTDDRGATGTDRVLVIPAGAEPELRISYPPPEADFEGRTSRTVVTGQVRDPNGTAIVDITINGEPAQLEPDDPTRFRGSAAVAGPRSPITVEAVDQAGERGTASHDIQSRTTFDLPLASAFDSADQRIFIFVGSRGVLELDLVTERQTPLLQATQLGLDRVVGAAFDEATGTLYFTGVGRNIIQAMDVAARRVETVSSIDIGSGPRLDAPAELVFDPQRRRLIVANASSYLAVDPETGDRTELAGPNRGEGPDFRTGIFAVDFSSNVLFLTFDPPGPDDAELVRIDLDTGDRESIANLPFSSGFPNQIFHHADQQRVYVGTGSRLAAFDPRTDSWSFIPDDPMSRPDLSGLAHLDTDRDRALFVQRGKVADFDLTNFSLELLFGRSIGTGPSFKVSDSDLHFDDASDTLFLLAQLESESLDRVFEIDARGGDRTVLSTSFPLRFEPSSLVYDPFRSDIYIADQFTGLWLIDRDTSAQIVVDGREYLHLALAGDGNRMFAAIQNALDLELATRDLETGLVSVFSGPNAGSGPAFGRSRDLAYDAKRNRVFVLDIRRGELSTVDIDSGKRSTFRILFGLRVGIDTLRDRILILESRQINAIDLETRTQSIIGPLPRSDSFAVDSDDQVAYVARQGFGDASGIVAVELGSGNWVDCSR